MYVVVPLLTNHATFQVLRNLPHHPIDLCGSDPNSAQIEGRITAPMDDHTSVAGPRGEVALCPEIPGSSTDYMCTLPEDSVSFFTEATKRAIEETDCSVDGHKQSAVRTSATFTSSIPAPNLDERCNMKEGPYDL